MYSIRYMRNTILYDVQCTYTYMVIYDIYSHSTTYIHRTVNKLYLDYYTIVNILIIVNATFICTAWVMSIFVQ